MTPQIIDKIKEGDRIKISRKGKKWGIRQQKGTSQTGTVISILGNEYIRVWCDGTKLTSITRYHISFWERI